MNRKTVIIIVLTWNKCDLAVKCLKSLEKIKTRHILSIILVDNNSTDQTVKTVEEKFANVKILQNKQNLGWSGGNNVGIKYSLRKKVDYIILLNNDVTVDKNFVDELVLGMEKHPEVGIASPKIYRQGTKPPIISNAGNFFNEHFFGIAKGGGQVDRGQCDNTLFTDFVSGVVCAKSLVYKKSGLLDERFFLYYEDAEFCARAVKKGFKCIFVQSSYLYHMESATIGSNSPSHAYYNSRNRLLYLKIHKDRKTLIREFFFALQLIMRKLRQNDKNWKYEAWGLADYLLGKFGARKHWN